MTARAAALVPPAWVATWDRASKRERVLVVLALVVVAGALAWAFVWLPLTRDLARLAEQQPRSRATLVAARALADDIAALSRAAPAARGDELRAALERVLAERGLRGTGMTLEAQDRRVRAVVPALAFPALVGVVDAARADAGAYVTEATITPRVEPGTVRAEIVFAR